MIQVASCSYRTVRGRTTVALLCDEIAHWRAEGANPDKEVLGAIRPSMATIPNSLLCAGSSPYARFGALYETYDRYFGKDSDEVLFWKSPARVLNPTLNEAFIESERQKDPQAAVSEWDADFRTDVSAFLSPDIVDAACILPGTLAPERYTSYQAFCDPSGGRHDRMCLAIGHYDRRQDKYLVDCLRYWETPFVPDVVVYEIADILKRYRINTIVGDRYSAGWVENAFDRVGIRYIPAERSKSDIFLEVEGYLNTRRCSFPKDDILIHELLTLERRAKGKKDTVDHPPTGSDDLANTCCGLVHCLVGFSDSYFSDCNFL